MQFTDPLILGRFVRRYQRFLMEADLEDGSRVTAACPNTGSMRSCLMPGWRVALSRSRRATRKYPYTWELVHNGDCWIGINTQWPNRLVYEAIDAGRIPALAGYAERLAEQRYGANSRIDLLLRDGPRVCYVEVKNVTLRDETGAAAFPDCVTVRGRKHLEELSAVVRAGQRAVMLYVVQRSDVTHLRIAGELDPEYAAAFATARAVGVDMLAYRADVSPAGITLVEALPFTAPGGRARERAVGAG